MSLTTVILGASNKPERFAYKANLALLAQGHSVILVAKNSNDFAPKNCFSDLTQITTEIDTLTVYINPNRLADEVENLLKLKPRRVIFNPGTESPVVATRLNAAGIKVVENCTLVMLASGRF